MSDDGKGGEEFKGLSKEDQEKLDNALALENIDDPQNQYFGDSNC